MKSKVIKSLLTLKFTVFVNCAFANTGIVPECDSFDIGIDVGGTNTDAALIGHRDGQASVVASFKATTCDNPTDGIRAATEGLLGSVEGLDKGKVKNIMLGTTHLLNAVVQGKVSNAAVIRLALPSTTSIPPLTTWNENLKARIGGDVYVVEGGFEYDGRTISEINEAKIKEVAEILKKKGVKAAAIVGVYSNVNPSQEMAVEQVLHGIYPELVCTLSHKIGGPGLLERENAAVLNASLIETYNRVCTTSLQEMTAQLNLTGSRQFLSRNDGTLENITGSRGGGSASAPAAVRTVNSGPSNTMIGAAKLSDSRNVIVVDIGGTTTDFGVVTDSGFPNDSQAFFEIARGTGVWCNFSQPKVESIGLGGGSRVLMNDDGTVSISEQSVGNKLTTADGGIAFGGPDLTVTDVALVKGVAAIDGANVDLVRQKYTRELKEES